MEILSDTQFVIRHVNFIFCIDQQIEYTKEKIPPLNRAFDKTIVKAM